MHFNIQAANVTHVAIAQYENFCHKLQTHINLFEMHRSITRKVPGCYLSQPSPNWM